MAISLDPTGITQTISSVSSLFDDLINKIWPNPEDKAKAEAIAVAATAQSAIQQLQAAQSVMLAEAQSADKWTSRARPSFLYVMYVMILASIPFGIVTAVAPGVGANITTGLKLWLAAIPAPLWDLFQVVALGYMGARTLEKGVGLVTTSISAKK